MAELAVTWVTAMAIESLAGYFTNGVEEGVGKWSKNLHDITASRELKAIEGEQASN